MNSPRCVPRQVRRETTSFGDLLFVLRFSAYWEGGEELPQNC